MTDIVKVVQTDLGVLVQRRADLEESVRDLKAKLKRLYPFDEARERARRLESLKYLKEGIADRIKSAEEYAAADIIDPHIEISNGLGEAEVELANVRRQLKAHLG